jgi:hypothetical protein
MNDVTKRDVVGHFSEKIGFLYGLMLDGSALPILEEFGFKRDSLIDLRGIIQKLMIELE